MDRTSTTASHARVPYYLSCSITCTAYLLDHERTLSNRYEALATASAASRCRCAWFRTRSFTCSTNVSSSKCHNFLGTIDSLHKVDLKIEYNVLTFSLSLCSSCILLSTEHLLKLFENVTEWAASRTAAASLRPPELV